MRDIPTYRCTVLPHDNPIADCLAVEALTEEEQSTVRLCPWILRPLWARFDVQHGKDTVRVCHQ